MAKLILITGGARSGKSSYALSLAESYGAKRLFIATCPTIDPEMSDRVERHKLERQGRGWTTCETEIMLAQSLLNEATGYDVVLIDCMTLWINNLIFNSQKKEKEINDAVITDLCLNMIDVIREIKGTVIIVTNEVGLGIVPDNTLARIYRDLVGTANQTIGKAADDVALVSCGIPHYLKKSASNNDKEERS